MDPIGGVASLLTHAQFAGILGNAGQDLCHRLLNAPQELQDVTAQILLVKSELDRVHYVAERGHPDLIGLETRRELQAALTDARDCLSALDSVQGREHNVRSFKGRVRWVWKDRKQASECLAAFRRVKDRLSFLLSILTFQGSSLVLGAVEELKSSLESTATTDSNIAIDDQYPDAVIMPKQLARRRLESMPWVSRRSWATLGVIGSLVPSGQGLHTDYSLALRADIPLAYLLGPYAIMLHVSVRTFPLCPGKFEILHGSSLALARTVKADDPFMAACACGDLQKVRRMLLCGQGRPTDVADRNWTPLAYAICSGSTETVLELLSSGADIDAPMGVLQTTPLQWAIWHKQLDVTRLLVGHGASQDHVNNIGWNVTFYCWPRLEQEDRTMLDYLQVLSEDAVQDLDLTDSGGWTVLHRVSAFGMPGEILALIKLGAKPEQVAFPLRWNALHHATFYGNYAAFEALLPFFDHGVTSMTDERGWTLLHIAASAGHDQIVRRLLRLGADPGALSRPFWSPMPESLYGKECTPEEVVAAQSTERRQQYFEALRSHGLGPADVDEDVQDEVEAFWDAQETTELSQL